MAIEAMEVDPPIAATPPVTELPERKRKHKTHDPASKKKRKHETGDHDKKKKKKKEKKDKDSKSKARGGSTGPDSPYTLTTATLYVPLSPISISPTHALASLLAEHLSPLLLTYYPPLKGIVLAYSNASISSTPPDISSPSSSSNPQPLTLAVSSHEYGVLYVYLTATFLVFRPQKGQILEGWVNVQSEGFLGAVVLNLFSVGIERKRLPADWKWIPPGEEQDTASNNGSSSGSANITKTEGDESDVSEYRNSSGKFDAEKEHFKPVPLASDTNPLSETLAQNPHAATEGNNEDDDSAAEGYFQSVSGHRVRGTVRFRVLDIDVIPGTDRERGFMSVEGSMLSPEEEKKVIEDERNGILSTAAPRRPTPVQMSGALAGNTTINGETEPTTITTPTTSSAADTPHKPQPKDDKAKSKKDKSEEKEKKKSKSKKKDKEKEDK